MDIEEIERKSDKIVAQVTCLAIIILAVLTIVSIIDYNGNLPKNKCGGGILVDEINQTLSNLTKTNFSNISLI